MPPSRAPRMSPRLMGGISHHRGHRHGEGCGASSHSRLDVNGDRLSGERIEDRHGNPLRSDHANAASMSMAVTVASGTAANSGYLTLKLAAAGAAKAIRLPRHPRRYPRPLNDRGDLYERSAGHAPARRSWQSLSANRDPGTGSRRLRPLPVWSASCRFSGLNASAPPAPKSKKGPAVHPRRSPTSGGR
jgi:hypothetical protein